VLQNFNIYTLFYQCFVISP